MSGLMLSDSLEKFSAAAIDSSCWGVAMDAIVDIIGAYGAGIFPIRGLSPRFPHSKSLECACESYLKGGWIERDERYRATRHLVSKRVTTEFDFITTVEIARHPYYQEFLAPHKLRWFAGVKMEAGEDVWCLSIQRTIEQGPFTPRELNDLAVFSERLGGVGTLAKALGFARAEGALAAFEAADIAIVMLDRSAEVIFTNPSAERLLSSDLTLRERRIASFDREATAALDLALHELLWAPKTLALGRPVQLPRLKGRPILAYPMRLIGISADAFSPCQALVMLINLDRRRRPPDSLLRICFKLTPSEARLALRIGSGVDLNTASEELRITRATARAQLRSIFAKTEVNRQSELVALLSNLLVPRYD